MTTHEMKAYGQLIRKARQARGTRQEPLGRSVGRNQSYISNIETGKSGPATREDAESLALAVGVDADEACWLAGYLPPSLCRLRDLKAGGG